MKKMREASQGGGYEQWREIELREFSRKPHDGRTLNMTDRLKMRDTTSCCWRKNFSTGGGSGWCSGALLC